MRLTATIPPLSQIQFSTTKSAQKQRCSTTSGLGESSIHSTITTDASKQEPRAKRVQFKANVRVRKVSSHKSFSAEERRNMWYSSAESKELRADAVETVKKMMKGKDVDAERDDCSRGLEFKTPKRNRIRQQKKQLIIWAVIDEQDSFLEENGHSDGDFLDIDEIRRRDQVIADVYKEKSLQCATEAFNRGLKDAYDASR